MLASENTTKTATKREEESSNEEDKVKTLLNQTLSALTTLLNITDAEYSIHSYTVDNTTDTLSVVLEFSSENAATIFAETVNENIETL